MVYVQVKFKKLQKLKTKTKTLQSHFVIYSCTQLKSLLYDGFKKVVFALLSKLRNLC